MSTAKSAFIGLASVLLLGACQSTAERLAGLKPKAVQTAETRGRFELSCPAATGTLLSDQEVPPAIDVGRFRGPERAVFTVGVSGCGQRATYVVVCPEDGSGNCFAADGRR